MLKARAWKVLWRADYDARPAVHARVITPDGRAHLLDSQLATEVAVPQDSRSASVEEKSLIAPLPALMPGAVVEDEVVVDELTPYCDHGMLQHVVCQGPYPIRKQRLPGRCAGRADAALEGPRRRRASRRGPRGTAAWCWCLRSGRKRRTALPEPYVPADLPLVAEIVFSNGKSWADAAAGYAAIIDRQTDPAAVWPASCGKKSAANRTASGSLPCC